MLDGESGEGVNLYILAGHESSAFWGGSAAVRSAGGDTGAVAVQAVGLVQWHWCSSSADSGAAAPQALADPPTLCIMPPSVCAPRAPASLMNYIAVQISQTNLWKCQYTYEIY